MAGTKNGTTDNAKKAGFVAAKQPKGRVTATTATAAAALPRHGTKQGDTRQSKRKKVNNDDDDPDYIDKESTSKAACKYSPPVLRKGNAKTKTATTSASASAATAVAVVSNSSSVTATVSNEEDDDLHTKPKAADVATIANDSNSSNGLFSINHYDNIDNLDTIGSAANNQWMRTAQLVGFRSKKVIVKPTKPSTLQKSVKHNCIAPIPYDFHFHLEGQVRKFKCTGGFKHLTDAIAFARKKNIPMDEQLDLSHIVAEGSIETALLLGYPPDTCAVVHNPPNFLYIIHLKTGDVARSHTSFCAKFGIENDVFGTDTNERILALQNGVHPRLGLRIFREGNDHIRVTLPNGDIVRYTSMKKFQLQYNIPQSELLIEAVAVLRNKTNCDLKAFIHEWAAWAEKSGQESSSYGTARHWFGGHRAKKRSANPVYAPIPYQSNRKNQPHWYPASALTKFLYSFIESDDVVDNHYKAIMLCLSTHTRPGVGIDPSVVAEVTLEPTAIRSNDLVFNTQNEEGEAEESVVAEETFVVVKTTELLSHDGHDFVTFDHPDNDIAPMVVVRYNGITLSGNFVSLSMQYEGETKDVYLPANNAAKDLFVVGNLGQMPLPPEESNELKALLAMKQDSDAGIDVDEFSVDDGEGEGEGEELVTVPRVEAV